MMGTSPFIGAGQFGSKALEYRRLFFEQPENMTKLFVKSAELGVKAVQLVGYEPLVSALQKAVQLRFPEGILHRISLLFRLLSLSLFRCTLCSATGLMQCLGSGSI